MRSGSVRDFNSIANLFSIRNLNDIRRKLDDMAETRRTNVDKLEVW